MRRLALLLPLLAGCAGVVDRFGLEKLVPVGLASPDTDKVCAMGEALVHPLASVSKRGNPPHRAMIIAEAVGGICPQTEAWEADLGSLRAQHSLGALGPETRAAEVRDRRLLAERSHAAAAARFWLAFGHVEAEWGPVGEGECPRIARDHEIAYLVGLVGGTLALLHDRASGGVVGVPLDTLGKVARGSQCLDDARWWSVPGALQAASWATIPGSGPPDVDPWAVLAEKAAAGEASGVRVARALQVLIGANAGRSAIVEEGIRAHALSLMTTPQNEDYALLDEYARIVTLHQSDRLWTTSAGHRTPRLGELPSDAPPALQADPFGADPFGADPFGADPFSAPENPGETP